MGASAPIKAVEIATGLGLGALAVGATASLAGTAADLAGQAIAKWQGDAGGRGTQEAAKVAQLAQERRDFLEATKGVVWGPRPKTAAKP